MKLRFLGGTREVGRSAILVDDSLLLDYGFKPMDPPELPLHANPDYLVVSHAHLDHSGYCFVLDAESYMNSLTWELSVFLAQDTLKLMRIKRYPKLFSIQDIPRFQSRLRILDYHEPLELGKYTIEYYNSHHIPGSCSILVDSPEKTLFYTADVNTITNRLLGSFNESFPDADILIMEGTYFGTDHPSRFELELRFVDSIMETLERGGIALIPCFSVERTQEIMLILHNYGVEFYLDGMGIRACKIMQRYPQYLDTKSLERALEFAELVTGLDHRFKLIQNPCAIVTTSGMLNGGPILFYLRKLHLDPKSKLLLTGFQIEGTNGRMALEKGCIRIGNRIIPLKLQIEQYDFSAHCGDKQLKQLASRYRNCEQILIVHGENSQGFAQWLSEQWGCRAYAPRLGEEIML